MGKKGESICSICKTSLRCADFIENTKFASDGLSICIIECEKFKK